MIDLFQAGRVNGARLLWPKRDAHRFGVKKSIGYLRQWACVVEGGGALP
jgi:hypothetical protein